MLTPKERTAPEGAAYRSQIIRQGVSRSKPSIRLERSYGPPTPADGFIEMLETALHEREIRCAVRPFETTAPSKRQLIEKLVVAFEQGTITLLDDPVLLNELEAYQAEQTGSGQERFGAPSGSHDDCVIACALAWSEVAAGRQVPRGKYPQPHHLVTIRSPFAQWMTARGSSVWRRLSELQ